MSQDASLSICRLCGSKTGVHLDIFDETHGPQGYLSKIESVIPEVVILRYDCLPKSICHICLAKVKEFYSFRETCLRTQTLLKHKYLPWLSSACTSVQNDKFGRNAPSPTILFLGGPLAYPFGVKEVEVLTLSDDEESNKECTLQSQVIQEDNLCCSTLSSHCFPSPATSEAHLSVPAEATQLTSLKNVPGELVSPTLESKLEPFEPLYRQHPAQRPPLKPTPRKPSLEFPPILSPTTSNKLASVISIKRGTASSADSVKGRSNTTRLKPKPRCKQKRGRCSPQPQLQESHVANSSGFSCISISDNNVIYTCHDCNKIFTRKEGLTEHSCCFSEKSEQSKLRVDSFKTSEDSNHSTSSVELLD